MRPMVILRPEPGNAATAARAAALGLEVRALPLFRTVPLAWDAPDADDFDALLLTSAATLRLGGDRLNDFRALPVFAVGKATAEAAEQAGFVVEYVGQTGAASLVPALIAAEYGEVLHLGGEETRDFDVGPLRIDHVAVYAAIPCAVPGLMEALGGAVALVHSPRAGAGLAELVPMDRRADTIIVAISDAAAEAAGAGWRAVEAAPAPNDEAMLALAADLCEI